MIFYAIHLFAQSLWLNSHIVIAIFHEIEPLVAVFKYSVAFLL
jgi:hypothetical protein